MSYNNELRALAAGCGAAAVTLFDRWEDGEVATETFVAVLAALVVGASSRAMALADLSVAATITRATARAVPTLGLLPDGIDTLRVRVAVKKILADSRQEPRPRIERLARNEPAQAAAQATTEAMTAHPEVVGWTRSLNGDGCQLCTWWARDGRVWPADHPMPRHPGCNCTPRPVIRTNERTAQ